MNGLNVVCLTAVRGEMLLVSVTKVISFFLKLESAVDSVPKEPVSEAVLGFSESTRLWPAEYF
jgi:hypothetical protein